MIFLIDGHAPRLDAHAGRDAREHGARRFLRGAVGQQFRPAELVAGLGEGEDADLHGCDVAERRAARYIFASMLSLLEARALIEQLVQPLAAAPTPLAAAHHRVLREDILAPDDLPAFDRSAMDGYAVIAGDESPRLRVVAEVQPGHAPAVTIQRGECARIFTGAQLPPGATQVLIQENVVRDGEWITPRERDAKSWIRRRGEDARRGDLMLTAGVRLPAGELARLAQLGDTTPLVIPAPRVLHFATGNDLVDPALPPGAGQIRDSNSTLLAALLADAGARLVAQDRCGDQLDALAARMSSEPAASWQLLLLSGGASVGDYVFGPRALERLGFTLHFRALNLRPGKPLVFATRDRQVAFVIPGNPVSHFVTFHVAIRRALECLAGAAPAWSFAEVALLADLPARPDPRETWHPAHVSLVEGQMRARPLAWQSSGDLRGLVSANALLPFAPGVCGAKKGALLDGLLLSSRW